MDSNRMSPRRLRRGVRASVLFGLAFIGGSGMLLPTDALASARTSLQTLDLPAALLGSPTATTLEPLSLTSTEVVLAGAVDPEGQKTDFRFKVGVASSEWCESGGASGAASFVGAQHELESTDTQTYLVLIALKGLDSGTEYCDQVIAENATGTTDGGQVHFVAGAPAVETESAVSTGPTAATVEGEIDAASQSTTVKVAFAKASTTWCTSHGASGRAEETSSSSGFGYEDEEFHHAVAYLYTLEPNTEYCAELAAENGSGSAHGRQMTFTTPPEPHVKTLKASVLNIDSATVEGEINPEGQPTSYSVQYAPANSIACQSGEFIGTSVRTPQTTLPYTDHSAHLVSVQLVPLSAGTEYCTRLDASTANQEIIGQIVKFVMPPTHTLAISTAGTGSGSVYDGQIPCSTACAFDLTAGTQAALVATPAAGSIFSRWGGACEGTGACDLTLTSDLQVTATFTAEPRTSPPSCRITSTEVTVKHAPKAGYLVSKVSCNQTATVKLEGLITEEPHAKGNRRHLGHRAFRLTPVQASLAATTTKTLALRIPAQALTDLRNRAKESLKLTLVAHGVSGTSEPITAIIHRLKNG